MQRIEPVTVTLNIAEYELGGGSLHLFIESKNSPKKYTHIELRATAAEIYEAATGDPKVYWMEDELINGEHDTKQGFRDIEDSDVTPDMIAEFLQIEMPWADPVIGTSQAQLVEDSHEREGVLRSLIPFICDGGTDDNAIKSLNGLIEEEQKNRDALLPF